MNSDREDTNNRDDEYARTVAQEVASIEAQLNSLRAFIAASVQGGRPDRNTELTLSPSNFAKQLLADRRARTAEFPSEFFSEPAWDLLLDLFVAFADKIYISVSSAVIAANVPQTTALRWITLLTDQGYLLRVPDPHDRRRVYVELASDTVARIQNYLEGIAKKWGIILSQ